MLNPTKVKKLEFWPILGQIWSFYGPKSSKSAVFRPIFKISKSWVNQVNQNYFFQFSQKKLA